jgi:hypothetical protein
VRTRLWAAVRIEANTCRVREVRMTDRVGSLQLDGRNAHFGELGGLSATLVQRLSKVFKEGKGGANIIDRNKLHDVTHR